MRVHALLAEHILGNPDSGKNLLRVRVQVRLEVLRSKCLISQLSLHRVVATPFLGPHPLIGGKGSMTTNEVRLSRIHRSEMMIPR